MKPKIMLALAVAALAAFLAGCGSLNPQYDKTQPISEANPEYVPDTNFLAKVQSTANTIHAVNDASAPVNPYAGIIDTVISLVVGGLTAGATVAAKAKNTLEAHKKATQTFANVVAGGNGALAALANAPDETTAGIIAQHLQVAPLPIQQPKTA